MTSNKPQIEDEAETSIVKYGVSKETLLNSNSFNIVSSKFQKRHNEKALNKYSDNITDLTAEQLMERLNLETTYFYSENGIEVLNAPVRTFGNYKRAILSLTKNNSTNSYILTYPDPDNTKLFYVSNLDGALIQKVTIGEDGIGKIEYFTNYSGVESRPSQNYAMRGGSCTETVYQRCSSGNHSFDSGNAMDCTYWHDMAMGTPPQVFQVPTECGDSGDSGGHYDSGGGGSGGGGYNTAPPGNGGPPNNISPIECVIGLDCEDCGLPADLNNDCEVTFEEAHFSLFLQNLNHLQLSVYNNLSQNNKTDIFNYLVANAFGQEAKDFAILALDPLNDGAEVDFANKIIKDPTFVGTKADCVLTGLLTHTGYFKEVMDAFTNNNSVYKIKFIIKPLSNQNNHGEGETSPPDDNNIITITLAPNSADKNSLELASTILHEGVHAQLFRMLASGNKADYNLSQQDYNWLLELEKFWSTNSELPVAQHDFMTVRYVNKIATSIRKFDENTHPIENYMFFGWDGLYDEGRNRGLIDRSKFNEYQSLAQIPLNDNHNTLCD